MKKIIILVIMITVLTGSVFAQSLPTTSGIPAFASPQNTATQGRIRSAADDFIRPDAYHNVNFDNWFGIASFSSDIRATLGFATRFGKSEEGEESKKPVYMSFFYGGSAWANFDINTKREAGGITYFPAAASTDLPVLSSALPYNQFAILLGAADMGFRLSFISTYKSINQKDFTHIDNTDPFNLNYVHYKKYQTGNGLNSIQLAWSMSKNLTKVGIRPWAAFDLDFNYNFNKNQVYDGNIAGNTIVSNSVNFIQPILQFGLGGIIVHNNKGWRTSIDMEYRMRLRLHNNEFSYTHDGRAYSQVAKIKGRNRNGAIDEYFWMDHRIRPSISTQWNGEKLRLRSKLDLNFEFQSIDSTAKTVGNNGALISNGANTNEFTFRFNPDLALAAQWQMASKFFLNIGGRVNVSALNLTTTKGSAYTDDTKNNNSDYKTTSLSFGAVSNELTLGLTINATNNLFIEATCGVGSDNIVNTFATTKTSSGKPEGLLIFGGILLGLKF